MGYPRRFGRDFGRGVELGSGHRSRRSRVGEEGRKAVAGINYYPLVLWNTYWIDRQALVLVRSDRINV
jgi:hypothetical protein